MKTLFAAGTGEDGTYGGDITTILGSVQIFYDHIWRGNQKGLHLEEKRVNIYIASDKTDSKK